MLKKEFLNPEVDVIEFETKDVITNSPTDEDIDVPAGGGLIDGGTNVPGSGGVNWGDIWGN